jgi:hypothetical protein
VQNWRFALFIFIESRFVSYRFNVVCCFRTLCSCHRFQFCRQFNTNSSDESDTDFEIMTVETHDVNIIQNKLFAHMILIDDKKEVASALFAPVIVFNFAHVDSKALQMSMHFVKVNLSS